MIPENLLFISAQPSTLYFLWQVEVQIVNFKKHNISHLMHVLVWYPDNEIRKTRNQEPEKIDLQIWLQLAAKYPEVNFHFYKDQGVNLDLYIPQLRPHILSRHFDKFPELTDKVIFYHDSDIIFNFLPDFEKLLEGDICWQSDTTHYLDYSYLLRKEVEGKIPHHEAIDALADIGGISTSVLQDYDGKTGGAQYILRGIDGNFWREVELSCLKIRTKFSHHIDGSVNKLYFDNESAGFQSWCADMWAVNMALWRRGKITNVTPDLDFGWATDSLEKAVKLPIYHNAGCNGTQDGVFFKNRWTTISPIGKRHAIKPDSASVLYADAIHEVK